MPCEDCAFYEQHPIYPFLGYCKNQERVVFDVDKCDKFINVGDREVNLALETRGWVYCMDCKQAIYSAEDALNHINHHLTIDFMFDSVAGEEVPVVG